MSTYLTNLRGAERFRAAELPLHSHSEERRGLPPENAKLSICASLTTWISSLSGSVSAEGPGCLTSHWSSRSRQRCSIATQSSPLPRHYRCPGVTFGHPLTSPVTRHRNPNITVAEGQLDKRNLSRSKPPCSNRPDCIADSPDQLPCAIGEV